MYTGMEQNNETYMVHQGCLGNKINIPPLGKEEKDLEDKCFLHCCLSLKKVKSHSVMPPFVPRSSFPFQVSLINEYHNN